MLNTKTEVVIIQKYNITESSSGRAKNQKMYGSEEDGSQHFSGGGQNLSNTLTSSQLHSGIIASSGVSYNPAMQGAQHDINRGEDRTRRGLTLPIYNDEARSRQQEGTTAPPGGWTYIASLSATEKDKTLLSGVAMDNSCGGQDRSVGSGEGCRFMSTQQNDISATAWKWTYIASLSASQQDQTLQSTAGIGNGGISTGPRTVSNAEDQAGVQSTGGTYNTSWPTQVQDTNVPCTSMETTNPNSIVSTSKEDTRMPSTEDTKRNEKSFVKLSPKDEVASGVGEMSSANTKLKVPVTLTWTKDHWDIYAKVDGKKIITYKVHRLDKNTKDKGENAEMDASRNIAVTVQREENVREMRNRIAVLNDRLQGKKEQMTNASGPTENESKEGQDMRQEIGLMAEDARHLLNEDGVGKMFHTGRSVEGFDAAKFSTNTLLEESVMDALAIMYNRNPDIYNQTLGTVSGNQVRREDISIEDTDNMRKKEDIVKIDADTVSQQEIRELRERYYLSRRQEPLADATNMVTSPSTFNGGHSENYGKAPPSSTISRNPNVSDSEEAEWNLHTNGRLENTGSPYCDPMFNSEQPELQAVQNWRQCISKALVPPMKIATSTEGQQSNSEPSYDVGSLQNSSLPLNPSDTVHNSQDDMWDNNEEDDKLDTTYGKFCYSFVNLQYLLVAEGPFTP